MIALLLAIQDPATDLARAREAKDYDAVLQAALALREAGTDPWSVEDFTAALNEAWQGGDPAAQARLFVGAFEAFPERQEGLAFYAAVTSARAGVNADRAPAWMEGYVDRARARADSERGETEWSMYRSYLAYVYRRCGVEDNPLAREEAEPGARFEEVTDAAGLAGAPGKRVAVSAEGELLFRGALYRWTGDRFVDATAEARLPGAVASSGIFADCDDDGAEDVVLAGSWGLRIFLRRGAAFEEATDRSSFAPFPASPEGIAAGDLDGDGLIDLYVAVYEEPFDQGHADHAYRNLGRGLFEEATERWEMAAGAQCGRGVAMADYDNDGDLDVYVANYRLDRNFLWRNLGGRFEDAAAALGVAGTETQGAYGHSIGAAWGDIDGDGRIDLVVANLAHPRFIEFSDKTHVFLNRGDRFEDVFPTSGIAYEETHSDVSLADYDNDGDLDAYFTSIYAERPSSLYQNDGTGHFAPVTWRAGVVVFDGWGHAWMDYDRDGDLDLVVCGDRVRLFRNAGNENHWIRFAGLPIGARVTVGTQIRDIAGGRGTSSEDAPVAHFGLGADGAHVTVEIRSPGGHLARRRRVAVDREHRLEPP